MMKLAYLLAFAAVTFTHLSQSCNRWGLGANRFALSRFFHHRFPDCDRIPKNSPHASWGTIHRGVTTITAGPGDTP
jgi:hypothetical protein